jgi:hypothetical protein
LEKQLKKALKENKMKDDLLWRYQMIHERLYSDYCYVYDAMARSTFARVRPHNQKVKESFVIKYLKHKTPLWQVDNGFLTVAPAQITMDYRTPLATTVLDKLEESERNSSISAGGSYTHLSKALIDTKNRSPEEKEEILTLMMGMIRYTSRDRSNRLGIVPEPEADILLTQEAVTEILEKYADERGRFDLDQYIPEEDTEEEEEEEDPEVLLVRNKFL